MGRTFADRDGSFEASRDEQLQPTIGKLTLAENQAPAVQDQAQAQPQNQNQPGTSFESPRTVELLAGYAQNDFTFALAAEAGPLKFKGNIKLDPKTNGVVQLKDDRNKLQLAPVSAQIENGKKDIGVALLKESFYLGQPPWPLEGIRPELQTKLLDLKLSEDPSKLKVLTLAFVVKGKILDESLVPEPFRGRYDLKIEFSVEHSVTLDDVGILAKLGGLVDDALAKGAELLGWEDKLKSARQLVDEIGSRKTVLEDLVNKSKMVNGKMVRPPGYQQAVNELKQIAPRLLKEQANLQKAKAALPALQKAFTALHDEWLAALGKLSPLLAKFRGPLVEKICTKLVALFGTKLFRALHPFLLIAGAVLDLMYIVKFLIDWYRGKIKYAGFGKGDYEPSLLDWEAAPDVDGEKGGASTGDGATPTQESPNQKKLAALGGPRARLAKVLLRDGLEQTMEPRHFDRLISILSSFDITPDDVDRVIANMTVGMGPDAALDALERFLQQTKLPQKPKQTQTQKTQTDGDGGGGGGKTKKRNGGGTGDGGGNRRVGGGYLTADDGGVFKPTSTGGIDLKVKYGTYAIYLPNGGRSIKIPGSYQKRDDGGYDFVPRESGVRVVRNPKGEKIGEVYVKPRYSL